VLRNAFICYHYSRKVRPTANNHSIADQMVASARRLSKKVQALRFSSPVSHVYNPLHYAWQPHELYLRRYCATAKRVVFMGMNPGPFGMVQTGVPFGEIKAVREWLGIEGAVKCPTDQHPKRPVSGFACVRSEVSGQRLWGLFADRFGKPQAFFAEHVVLNYCPLAFLEETGRNRTPDKLSANEKQALFDACDEHLRNAVRLLRPEWIVGIGEFAYGRATEALPENSVRRGKILHPSPASPAANRDWANAATKQLKQMGVW